MACIFLLLHTSLDSKLKSEIYLRKIDYLLRLLEKGVDVRKIALKQPQYIYKLLYIIGFIYFVIGICRVKNGEIFGQTC